MRTNILDIRITERLNCTIGGNDKIIIIARDENDKLVFRGDIHGRHAKQIENEEITKEILWGLRRTRDRRDDD